MGNNDNKGVSTHLCYSWLALLAFIKNAFRPYHLQRFETPSLPPC
ncbi:hypothetical protein [Moraxella lacunata]